MPSFQVGDPVRVLENTPDAPGSLRGQTGTVTAVGPPAAPPDEILYTVRFEALGRDAAVYESALEAEVARAAAPSTTTARTGSPAPTLRDRIIEYEVNSRTAFGDDVPLDELDDPTSTAGWEGFLRTFSTHNTRDPFTEPTRRAHWEALKAAPVPTGAPVQQPTRAAPTQSARPDEEKGEGAGTPQWLFLVVALPIIFLLNFALDLGLLPAILIGAVIGMAVSLGLNLLWRR